MTGAQHQTANPLFAGLTRGIEPHKVLCWVGSAETRDWIVHVGKALSDSCNASCHAVMCLDCPSRAIGSSAYPERRMTTPLTPEVIGQAGKKLSALYGEDIHTMVLPGHPVAEIRRYALTHQIDLLLMGEQALAVERVYGERLLEDPPCMLMILAMPGKPDARRPFFEDGPVNHER